MVKSRWTRAALCMATVLAAAPLTGVLAKELRSPTAAGSGSVNLPYIVADNTGNQWRIYNYGQIQQSGNMPLYSQGAMLMINGNQVQTPRNQARVVDEKTGEIALENMAAPNGLVITRRILVDKTNNFVRYVDIFRNTTGQDQNVQVMIQTGMNYGVTASQMVTDPKKKDQNIGWVGVTGPNGNGTVLELFSGKGTKTPLQIQYQQGNTVVQGILQATIPANKEIAVLHLHAIVASPDAGAKFARDLKDSQVMKDLPQAIRKLIVNFSGGLGLIGDVEVLRGDLLDVVELKGGDQLKGTLKAPTYDLDTFYGPVSLPVERVIAFMNVGQFRSRQLVVTSDGQIFGGRLKKETVDLQLSSGQVTSIPLSQVSRAGYRKRDGEPEEWTFEKPIILMRSGERVGVKMPTTPFEVATRYGRLSLKPEQLAAVALENEDISVHQIFLADGSKFSGLLAADQFKMALDAPGAEQSVTFPVSAISRMQLTNKIADVDDAAATLQLANDDLLVGAVTGQLKVDTAFDTLTVNTNEIKTMSRLEKSPLDVQIMLWDGSTLSGQLQDLELQVKLAGGVEMKVPVSLLRQYDQPQPQPSGEMVERIRKVAADLNGEDWKQRDRAQAALVGIGPVAIPVLKQMRQDQPPEAQQRIDAVVRDLEKQRERNKAASAPSAGAGAPGQINKE